MLKPRMCSGVVRAMLTGTVTHGLPIEMQPATGPGVTTLADAAGAGKGASGSAVALFIGFATAGSAGLAGFLGATVSGFE